jgi:hypothetical protein
MSHEIEKNSLLTSGGAFMIGKPDNKFKGKKRHEECF